MVTKTRSFFGELSQSEAYRRMEISVSEADASLLLEAIGAHYSRTEINVVACSGGNIHSDQIDTLRNSVFYQCDKKTPLLAGRLANDGLDL
tara:strand:- start:601 stop:873 length:273 start_codon:yes stop_codon:yes gene_type:complete